MFLRAHQLVSSAQQQYTVHYHRNNITTSYNVNINYKSDLYNQHKGIQRASEEFGPVTKDTEEEAEVIMGECRDRRSHRIL